MTAERDPGLHLLDPEESRAIFDVAIAGRRFAHLTGVDEPTVHFFGGQPGAGKSSSQQKVIDALHLQSGAATVAVIIGDEFRGYHPQYAELLATDDANAAFYTDRDSARWVEMSIDHATAVRSHIVLEGTLRNPDVTLGSARAAIAQGYSAELHVMAVHEFVSRQRILRRYVSQVSDSGHGRYTLREAHDRAYRAIPASVQAIAEADALSAITVYDANADEVARVEAPTSTDLDDVLAELARQRDDAFLEPEPLIAALDEMEPTLVSLGRAVPLEDLRALRLEIASALR
ncbi:zeta toxin family protein [Nocardioides sp. AE5]|uniref:zeta toxin family protein n=1 Tax=Nocardioides sp. AE5 TaxID=2962573 RepID=UPI0028823000|nr:zeta toxin family protein [Nocardioides sp. AE5]MDT0202357.1 zeta toxin family protein [Nocardioides sp. AE5]